MNNNNNNNWNEILEEIESISNVYTHENDELSTEINNSLKKAFLIFLIKPRNEDNHSNHSDVNNEDNNNSNSNSANVQCKIKIEICNKSYPNDIPPFTFLMTRGVDEDQLTELNQNIFKEVDSLKGGNFFLII
jgi:hypothetical protein